MSNWAGVYDSRNIVEAFLQHKLLQKGLMWRFNQQRSSSSSSLGSEEVRRSQSEGTLPPSGKDTNSHEDSQGALLHQQQPVDATLRLQGVLRKAGDQINILYQTEFQGKMSAHSLRSSSARSGSVRSSLAALRAELFKDGVNWGRIVALMEFVAEMFVDAVEQKAFWEVEEITDWLVESLETPPLRGWIDANGGWDAFVSLYEATPPVAYWSKTLIVLAILGAAGLILGALFTQR